MLTADVHVVIDVDSESGCDIDVDNDVDIDVISGFDIAFDVNYLY